MNRIEAAERLRSDTSGTWGGVYGQDNGVLFLAYAYVMLDATKELTDVDRTNAVRTENNIRVERGLYTRYPGSTLLEAHDNYIGLLLLSKLFNLDHIAKDVYTYGTRHLRSYNDQEPGTFNIRAWRQPGEFAVYSMAAGVNPGLISYLWLLVGMWVSPFNILTWGRVQVLKHSMLSLPWYKRLPLRWVINKRLTAWLTQDTFTNHVGGELNIEVLKALSVGLKGD